MSAARTALDKLLPAQKSLFEQMIPQQPAAAQSENAGPVQADAAMSEHTVEGGVGRHCIYKIQAGTLLFRSGAPTSCAQQQGASFPVPPPPEASSLLDDEDRALALSEDEARLCAADAQRQRRLNGGSDEAGGGRVGLLRHASKPQSSGPRLRPMPRVDARRSSGIRAAIAAARAPHAVLIEHAGLAGEEAGAWTGDELAAELGGVACHVLQAPLASNRFTYFWGGAGDRVHGHYEAPPTVSSVAMPFADFRRLARQPPPPTTPIAGAAPSSLKGKPEASSLYLQTGLAQRTPDGSLRELPVPGASLRRLLRRLRCAADGPRGAPTSALAGQANRSKWCLEHAAAAVEAANGAADEAGSDAAVYHAERGVRLVQAMASEGGFGRYTRTAFFASVPGAVTRLHYDHYDNVYVQLRGRKRFVLLEPLEAAAVYPFPLHHPLDQRARVHLDALPAGSSAYSRLGAAHGYEVDLGPGEVLFIPHHW